MWRHTRRGDRYVTVMIDLTPVRDRSGPARLLDVVPGRSKTVFKTWLSQRDQDWRGRVEVVATGRFHRVPRAPPTRSSHKPGRSSTPSMSWPWRPASRARRTLHTGAGLLTDTQARRLQALFADDRYAAVQAAWGVYQRLIQAYRTDEAGLGKYLMQRLIDSLKQAIPYRLEGDPDPGQNPDQPQPGRPGLLRPPPYLQRPHAKPSTDARSTYAASPWASATSPATPSAASSTPDASKTT